MTRVPTIASYCAGIILLTLLPKCAILAFQPPVGLVPNTKSTLPTPVVGVLLRPSTSTVAFATAAATDEEIPVTNTKHTNDNDDTKDTTSRQQQDEIARIKQELLDLSRRTSRGFKASSSEKRRARQLIHDLARVFDPTQVQPVRAYYKNNIPPKDNNSSNSQPEQERLSLQGKWELVFTDAPDITSLDQNNNLAQLGRIGQECQAPFIKNVIEWRQPDWARRLPSILTGTDDANDDARRVLQKVVTVGTADPRQPATVQLQVAGLQIMAAAADDDDEHDTVADVDAANAKNPWSWGLPDAIRRKGWIAGLLQQRPIDWVNIDRPLPFGKFDILYLDDTWRVTRTGQNHIAINRRLDDNNDDEAWF